MNVALTGATGFLGSALVRSIPETVSNVRALVRRPNAAPRFNDLRITVVPGSLDDAASLSAFVTPGAAVVHAAAHVSLGGGWPAFKAGTVDTTRNLLAVALPRRPARFVYVSSAVVYSNTDPVRGVCADRTPVRPRPPNFYGIAKAHAERLVMRSCDAAGVPWTIVRIAFVYGPGNHALIRQLKYYYSRQDRMFTTGRGENRIATIYVDDAAHAIWSAALDPQACGIYDAASDERVTQRDFLDQHLTSLHFPPTWTGPGLPVSIFAAGWAEWVAAAGGFEPVITRSGVALMGVDQLVDARRIRHDLGWRPQVSFEEGMRRFRVWLSRSRTPVGRYKKWVFLSRIFS